MSELLLSGWRYRAVIISIVIAALAYLGFSLWAGFNDVMAALLQVGAVGVLLMLGLSLTNYFLRFLRWQLYLRSLGYQVPWLVSWRIYLAGFALTTTPGKAGEALRGVFLKRWGVPYIHSLSAFLSERLSDLVAILLLALLGLSLYPQMQGIIVVGASGVMVGFLFLLLPAPIRWLACWAKRGEGYFRRFALHLSRMLNDARACHTLKMLMAATLLSIVAWMAEALAFNWMLIQLGFDVPIVFAIFVYAVAMLAGALSFLPGGLGGTETVMVGLLIWKGAGFPEAVAATVLIRLTTLWFAVILGAIALVMSRHEEKVI
ncbi:MULTISPECIES: lysylphosphatidylglycerol synthase transmembrane domain-containing protein [unclassified Methylomonas]|uniref:lysylphosphatidylglycerol synthase transmembrane domain-containing protein n=1 Tax=unclassified Methylomonas TaxID=2608980 RepID=UPI0008DA4B9F|nr:MULTISPECIES: lysylphosphatidylglycerol synthase transmembrane domain-containing protein [unclassified Methylomonas]NJA04839.1 flippase-like domain-containing protein [Methylococcaceae bacterium WWC4]OHX35249.1 hypothetical protein BJL95_01525 [Methylomonas sp. LWB]WGS87803.1 lysylphosphatidylglycerol synthase transmembrane domain-containing protein [Methylomonas sp. UP202]